MAQAPDTSDDSSDEWDQWEVVDVQTTTSKSGPSARAVKEQKKKKEVETLANIITDRLAANQAEEKKKIQELNDKIQAQQYQSEQQLEIIRKQLEQISQLQAIHSQQNAQNRLLAAKDKNEQAKLIEAACAQAANLAAQQATRSASRAANEAARKAANYACEQASAQVSEAANRAAQRAAHDAAHEAASKAANMAAQQAAAQAAQQANYQASQRDNAFLTNILNTFAINNNNNSNSNGNSNSNNNNNSGSSGNSGNSGNSANSAVPSDLSSMNAELQQILQQQNENINNNNNNSNNSSNINNNAQPNSDEMKEDVGNNNNGSGGGLFSALTTMFVGNTNDEQKSSQLLDDDCFWDCVACGATNDEAYQFCPKCGGRNDLVFNTNLNGLNGDLNTINSTAKGLSNIKVSDKNDGKPLGKKETDNAINVNLLKFEGAIGQDKKFSPGESRQMGWVFSNEATHSIKMSISIVNVNESDKLVNCAFEKAYNFNLKPKEDFYLLFNVKAPVVPGRYSNLYQLITDDSKIIPHTLELSLDVKNVFTKAKERKIADLVKMGFNDREKVVYALQKHKWNVQTALESLLQA